MGWVSGKLAGFAAIMLLPLLASGPAAGETVEVGDLRVSFQEVERRREISFGDVLYRPDEDFLVVRFEIRNEGGKVKVLRAPELLDGAGITHRASWKGWILPFSFSRYEALVPGTGRPFSVLFDVPAKGSYELVFHDGSESAGLPIPPLADDVVAEMP
jgi:hypothetical protein